MYLAKVGAYLIGKEGKIGSFHWEANCNEQPREPTSEVTISWYIHSSHPRWLIHPRPSTPSRRSVQSVHLHYSEINSEMHLLSGFNQFLYSLVAVIWMMGLPVVLVARH